MISLASTTRPAESRAMTLFREMLESWLAHYQRVHELGLRGGF